MPKFIYDYEDISFTLTIPAYWSEIYKGQPRKELYYDYRVLLDIVKEVDKDKWIMDVGENHGIFAVPASLLGYKVFGFEPVKSNFDNILQAKEDNNLKDFSVFNAALSNKNWITDIYVPECLDNSSFSAEAAIANMVHKEYTVEKVFTVRFDDWIKDYPEFKDVGLIKIDVQGSEFDVLSGMKEFLSNSHDIYLITEFESHSMLMGHTYEELENLILSLGFVAKGIIVGNDRMYYKQ